MVAIYQGHGVPTTTTRTEAVQGDFYLDVDTNARYINTGIPSSPTWSITFGATPPSTAQTLVAGTAILANAPFVMITAAAPITSTAAPTIANGVDGQRITVMNVGANAITLSDQGTLASSNLRLTATTLALAANRSIDLMYSSTVGDWVQVGNLVLVI